MFVCFLYILLSIEPNISSAYNFLFLKVFVYLKSSPLSVFKSFLCYPLFRDAFPDRII